MPWLLVTADAGDGFARHCREPAPHQLDCLAFFVQRLDAERRVGRDAEHRRAVFVNVNSTENTHYFPGAAAADLVRPGHSRITEMIGQNPQLFNGASRDTFESLSGINVVQINDSTVTCRIDSIRDSRGAGYLSYGNRFEKIEFGHYINRQHVIENVHKVDAPRAIFVQFSCNQEILVTQWVRMKELRPGFFNEFVADNCSDRLVSPGNFLDYTICILPAFGDVQQTQFTHPRHAVIAGDDGNNFARGPRYPSWKIQRVRPVGIAAVHCPLARAVRVHYH